MSINFPIPINFIVIPAITIAMAIVGSRWSARGVKSTWYRNLHKPKWTPEGSTIGEIWIFLYILTTLSFMWYWNVPVFTWLHYVVGALMLINVALNAYWNKLFFIEHDLQKALKEMKLMNGIAILVTIIVFFQASIAAIGMLPYIIWVGIATKLTSEIISKQNKKPLS